MSGTNAQEVAEQEQVTLVLISRTGEGLPNDEELARICAGRNVEVILAIAPWRPSIHARASRGTLVFPPSAPWGDVIAACVEAATSERMVFVELPAVQSLARVMQLIDELEFADVAGARLLRLDGVTLETGGGGFSSARLAVALESGTIASTLDTGRRRCLMGRPPRVRRAPRCAFRHGAATCERRRRPGRGRLGLARLHERAPRDLLADLDPDRRGSRATAQVDAAQCGRHACACGDRTSRDHARAGDAQSRAGSEPGRGGGACDRGSSGDRASRRTGSA